MKPAQLMDGTRRLALALGPGLAGVLVAVVPLAAFFALDALTFAVSALTVLRVGRGVRAARPRPVGMTRAGRGVLRDLTEGFATARNHPAIAWFIAAVAASNVGWAAAFQVGVPLLADRTLGGDVGAYGLIVGAYGAGSIASNAAMGTIAVRRPRAYLVGGRFVMALGLFVLALAPGLPAAMLGAALAAAGGPMGDIVSLALMHRDLPPDRFGRVYALRTTAGNLGAATGLLAAGPFFARVPVAPGIACAAALVLAVGVLGLLHFARVAVPATGPIR